MTTFSLITEDEVAAALSVPVDDQVTRVTAASERWAKRVTGRSFERKSRTVYVPGFGIDHVFLPEAPIWAVTEVRVDRWGTFNDRTIIQDLTEFFFTPGCEDFRLFWRTRHFPEGPRVAKVTFEAGYYKTGDDVAGHDVQTPEDLRDAMIAEAASNYRQVGNERFKDLRVGAYAIAGFDSGHDPAILASVRSYRRPI